MLERLQKFISQSGIASRRKAEEFIKSGQVLVNGKKAKLGKKVDPKKDVIKVYGKIIKPAEEEKIYVMLNKPKNYVVTKTDPQGRNTIYKLLPKELSNKIWNIGRLDYKTEGLIILTNDGDLTNKLTHPSFEHEKEYEVEISKKPSEAKFEKLEKGIKLDGFTTAPAKVKYRDDKLFITIHEGKKHQIRRMLNAICLDVQSLKRIRVGKLKLPLSLLPGKYKEIKKEEII